MNMSKTFAAALVAAPISACATPQTPSPITDTAQRTPQLSILAKLIDDAGLAQTLRDGGPYTVFAPSDEAFKALPPATLQALASDKELLKSVLSFHVLPGKVSGADVKNGNAKTVQGANVALAKSGSFITVEDAVVTQADVAASNGVVHVIDRVLMPPKK
jgi:uncharacterized surface protein with fasciclin (FAS1) repeats